MSKSNLVAFCVPAELYGAFSQAVAVMDGDKTAWLLDALRSKLNLPESNPQLRMLELVEQMEVALVGGKQGILPTLNNEVAVIGIVADTIREGFDNGRIIAERLNGGWLSDKSGQSVG